MRGGRRWLPHSKELDADRGHLEVRLLRLALAMKDVERVLRVVLQAANVIGAELGEVESVGLFTVDAAEVDREAVVDEDPDVIVPRELELSKTVVHESRADLRAEVEVVLPPLVAEAYLPELGVGEVVEVVGRLVFFLVVYREECGALERVLARRPAKGRVR